MLRELLAKSCGKSLTALRTKDSLKKNSISPSGSITPEYWRARQSGREAAEAARSTARPKRPQDNLGPCWPEAIKEVYQNGLCASTKRPFQNQDKAGLQPNEAPACCFSSAAAVGLPAYLFSRGSIGNSAAMFLMIGLMLPFFFLAMYERDGLPLEKVLKNIIRTRFLYPRVRPYKTENFYALLSARKEAQPIAKQQKGRKARRQKA